jgi:TM2 domain-containing membrane protein YozV
MKNRVTAILLAVFLGGWGAHKFYLRDAGTGIFYLMLTILSASFRWPIGYVLGWIDAFRLITMSEEQFDKKYNARSRSSRERGRRESRDSVERRRDNRYERRSTREYSNRSRSTPPKVTRERRTSYERKKKVIKDNPFKTSGIKRLDNFELDLAEVDLNRALELSPDDKDIHIALGRLFSIEEDIKKSMFHISKAVKLGYTDFNHIRTADGFAFLRMSDKFEEFEETGFRSVSVDIPVSDKKQDRNTIEAVTPPVDDLLQNDVLLSQLNKLKELRNKGIISEKEFEEERVKLIQR